ncbi:MAG: hypothetical protein ACLQFI_22415 [Methylocella sp.]
MDPEPGPFRRFERRASDSCLYSRLEITDLGFTLGAGTVLAKMDLDGRGRPRLALGDETRVRALLAAALGRPAETYVLEKMRRAAELWNEGEKALAHIHLAFARLPLFEGEEQTLRLRLAEECLDCGVMPAEVMKAQGSQSALLSLLKYDQGQARVPAGSGRASGQWTSDGSGGGGSQTVPAAASPPAVPVAAGVWAKAGTLAGDLLSEASPKFLAGLGELGAAIGGVGAVLGTIFVPSPNPGVTSEAVVPGDPDLHYAINHDEGTLRLTRQGAAGGEAVALARLGQDGVFYETRTGIPVARDVGGSIVFDAETLESMAAPTDSARISNPATAAAAQAGAEEETPKLCPDPGPDVPHGASERAIKYQAQISALNNPQRPLPPGLAVSLTNPVTGGRVAFDDCRENDGTMIEAKGPGYANKLENNIVGPNIRADWIEQATRQRQASGGRAIEWYFAEEAAADRARKLFDQSNYLRGRVVIHTVPAEAP